MASRAKELSDLGNSGHLNVHDDGTVTLEGGSVGIGTSSPSTNFETALHLNAPSFVNLHLTTNTTGTTGSDGFNLVTSSASTSLINQEATPLIFATSGSEKMRLDTGGSLLINRTSKISAEKLSVKGEIRAGYTASDNQVYLGVDSADAYLGTNATGFDLKFEAGGSERMRLDSNGNVGIGTTSPDAILDVRGGAASRPTFIHASGYGGIQIAGTGSSSGGALIFSNNYNTSVSEEYSIHLDGATDDLVFISGDPADIATQERMRLTDDGKLGIGTNNPSQNLHVSSSDHTRVLVTAGTDKYAELQFENDAQKFAMGVQNDNKFFLYNSTGTSQVLTVDTSSNIGIGTPSPAEKLEVNGSFKVGNLKIQNANGGRIGFNRNTANGAIYDSNYAAFQINGAYANADFMAFEAYTSGGVGTDAMAIRDNGNVGIGTTNPERPLHVKGSNAFVRIESTSVSQNSQLDIKSTAATWSIGQNQVLANTGTLEFYNGSSSPVVIKTNGNVGIGATDPGVKLDVTSSRSTGYSSTGDQRGLAHIVARNGSDAAGRFSSISWVSGGGTQAEGSVNLVQTGNYVGDFTFKLRDGSGSADWRERMRITGAGKVGIGTLSPATKLHVADSTTNAYSSTITKGSNHSGLTLVQNDGMTGVFFATGGSGAGSHWSAITGSRSNSSDWATQLNFYTHPSNVSNLNDANQRMIITGDGNVGIGTTNPQNLLHLESNSSGETKIRFKSDNLGGSHGLFWVDENAVNQSQFYYNHTANKQFLELNGNGLQIYSKQSSSTIAEFGSSAGGYNNFSIPNGSVGIGVTSPSKKLHVLGSGGASSTIQIESTGSGNTVFYMKGAAGNDFWGMFTGSTGGGFTLKDETNAKDAFNARPQGKMAYPNQTRFSAFGVGGSTSYSAGSPFVMTVVRNNINNRYNTANGIFTADVAGYYQFRFNAYTYNSGQWSVLYWNGSSISSFYDTNGTTSGGDHTVLCTVTANGVYHMAWTMHLASGKGCAVGWRSGYSGSIYRSHAQFSGELISAD